ncbi:MAG: sialate O-acetylesterase [Prevotellaceae bacterium]|nr:sialate O-acetylesterase [Candidatus Minthosoma caballi]
MKKIIIPLLMCCVALAANASLRLSSLLTDNMVLQQQTSARLWGWADAGSTVTVTTSWNKEKVTAKADGHGKWIASVATPAASFDAQSITIQSGKESVQLNDILIGEVWLASGQSNMEMPLKGFSGCCIQNGTEDALRANVESPYVRIYTVKKTQTYTPQETCEGSWKTPTFKNALDFSATAYYFASALSNALGVPVGIVNSSYGGAHVEGWESKELCEKYSDIPTDSVGAYNFGSSDYDRPMLMYNAMFCPIKDYTYKGIIWYQGCSNVGHADVYAQRLADMVKDWREKLGLGDIPFYQVEISPYIYGKDENDVQGALIREAQYNATKLIPNCALVSTNDLVFPIERYNIHPSQKRKVGARLSYLALNKVYGMNEIACEGPRFNKETFRIDGNKAVVSFITNNFGICRNWGLEGFEIAGTDKQFYPAKADFRWQDNSVTLTSDSVPAPVAVRYCFKDFQIGNLIGGNELPCYPFRTDNW